MTIVTTKNAPILTALFGLKPRNAMPCDITSKNCIRVSDEWFRLFVGTDANGAEFLAVFTAGESFVLSTLTGASAPSRPRQKRARWAFLIDDLPSDFSDHAGAFFVNHGDINVTFGLDDCQREFLAVYLPIQNRQYLFRNPASASVEPFNIPKALALLDQMVTRRYAAPITPSVLVPNSTGDADLDAMLNELN